jgi:hypothetical protein
MKNLFLWCLIMFVPVAFAAESTGSISSTRQLNDFLRHYYQHPEPGLVGSALRYVDASGIAGSRNARAALGMGFSCIFARYGAERRSHWREIIDGMGKPARTLLTQSSEKTPQELLARVPLSPIRNDMDWACFFATGDVRYLDDIISTLKYIGERRSLRRYITAASAKWSLTSNAISDERVRQTIEKLRAHGSPDMKRLASEMLSMSPRDVRDETVAVLKEQKARGVW